MAKKSTYKNLRILAFQIAQRFKEGKAIVEGSKLLKHNKDIKDSNGYPIQARTTYYVRNHLPVFNFRRLKRLHAEKGETGVMAYIDELAMTGNSMVISPIYQSR